MDEQTKPCVLFIVEDDEDDILLLSNELQANGLEKDAHFFSSINELIDFYNTRVQNSLPALILLSAFIEFPDVRDAVALIQRTNGLQTVPLVLMIDSRVEKDYFLSYHLNVSGYIVKPVSTQVLLLLLGLR